MTAFWVTLGVLAFVGYSFALYTVGFMRGSDRTTLMFSAQVDDLRRKFGR